MGSYTVAFDASVCITVDARDWEEAKRKATEICDQIDEEGISRAAIQMTKHELVTISIGPICMVIDNETDETLTE